MSTSASSSLKVRRFSLLLTLVLLCGGAVLLVLSFDLFELGHVAVEVLVLLESDEELGLLLQLATLSVTLHRDSLGLDLLEVSVVVSIHGY